MIRVERGTFCLADTEARRSVYPRVRARRRRRRFFFSRPTRRSDVATRESREFHADTPNEQPNRAGIFHLARRVRDCKISQRPRAFTDARWQRYGTSRRVARTPNRAETERVRTRAAVPRVRVAAWPSSPRRSARARRRPPPRARSSPRAVPGNANDVRRRLVPALLLRLRARTARGGDSGSGAGPASRSLSHR